MPTSKPSALSKAAGRGDRRGTQFHPYTIKPPDELHLSRSHNSRGNDGMFKTQGQEVVHPHPATRVTQPQSTCLSTSHSKQQQPPLHWTISEHPQRKPRVAEDEDKPISSSKLDIIFPKGIFITNLVTKKNSCTQEEVEGACRRVRLYREPSERSERGASEEDAGDDLEDDPGVDQPYMPGYLAENRQRCLQWLKNILSEDCR